MRGEMEDKFDNTMMMMLETLFCMFLLETLFGMVLSEVFLDIVALEACLVWFYERLC